MKNYDILRYYYSFLSRQFEGTAKQPRNNLLLRLDSSHHPVQLRLAWLAALVNFCFHCVIYLLLVNNAAAVAEGLNSLYFSFNDLFNYFETAYKINFVKEFWNSLHWLGLHESKTIQYLCVIIISFL